MLSNINLLASAAFLAIVGAATLKVDVGKNGLSFTPNSTVAAVGDVVEFHYYPKDHNVVQTSFSAPCQFNLPSPVFSGFMPVASGEGAQVFQVTVNSTSPIWFYCSQARHCQSGMVGVINEPASGNTLAIFAAKAAKAGNNTAPTVVEGGVVVANTDISSSSTSSVSTTTASAAATTSSTGSSTTSSPSASSTGKSGAVAMRAVRWSELLGVGIVVGGAALLMQ